jgi:mono/diheme cytochrome c family protein
VRLLPGRKGGAAIAGAAALALVALLMLSAARPRPVALPEHRADPARGEILYLAGSCLSCHEPAAEEADPNLPSGGAPFLTPVGTFFPQNLTPDPKTGIGSWSELDFVVAMIQGVSPEGRHYFPAFPYTSFARMTLEDLLDLRAYLMSLPPVSSPEIPPEIPFERLARRSVGLWKHLAFDPEPLAPDPGRSDSWNRGRYLVNGPGHCGECHTPRTFLMALDEERHLEGAPHPAGEEEGLVPGLRDMIRRGRYTDTGDLALALSFGETFGYDKISSGGMAAIQMNLGRLPPSDVQAIAEYLVSLGPAGDDSPASGGEKNGAEDDRASGDG